MLKNRVWRTRPFDKAADLAGVFALWQACLNTDWPLDRDAFERIVSVREPDLAVEHLLIEEEDKPIGFIAAASKPLAAGCISILLVSPKHQHTGVAGTLLQETIGCLRRHGIKQIHLGAKYGGYFFPGLPANLPQAVQFFQHFGWNRTSSVFDLIGDFSSYVTPAELRLPQAFPKGTIDTASKNDWPATRSFEEKNFPNWLKFFDLVADEGAFEDILIARDEHGEIAGSLLLRDQRAAWRTNGVLWNRLLGEDVGGVGCVGVSEAHRGRGIGLTLTAKAAEILRQRGYQTGFIGWTTLTNWYGKLGFQTWREYLIGTMEI